MDCWPVRLRILRRGHPGEQRRARAEHTRQAAWDRRRCAPRAVRSELRADYHRVPDSAYSTALIQHGRVLVGLAGHVDDLGTVPGRVPDRGGIAAQPGAVPDVTGHLLGQDPGGRRQAERAGRVAAAGPAPGHARREHGAQRVRVAAHVAERRAGGHVPGQARHGRIHAAGQHRHRHPLALADLPRGAQVTDQPRGRRPAEPSPGQDVRSGRGGRSGCGGWPGCGGGRGAGGGRGRRGRGQHGQQAQRAGGQHAPEQAPAQHRMSAREHGEPPPVSTAISRASTPLPRCCGSLVRSSVPDRPSANPAA